MTEKTEIDMADDDATDAFCLWFKSSGFRFAHQRDREGVVNAMRIAFCRGEVAALEGVARRNSTNQPNHE